MGRTGLVVGAPLADFQGVLTIAPQYHGVKERLDGR
jgi:hypothetical protein